MTVISRERLPGDGLLVTQTDYFNFVNHKKRDTNLQFIGQKSQKKNNVLSSYMNEMIQGAASRTPTRPITRSPPRLTKKEVDEFKNFLLQDYHR